jgi:hypothetical protein
MRHCANILRVNTPIFLINFLILFSGIGFAQIDQTQYDSIVKLDDRISTAYKKTKVFYLDQAGERLVKGGANSLPFINGQGVLNKGGRLIIIDSSGKKAFKYSKKYQAEQYHGFVFVQPKNVNAMCPDEVDFPNDQFCRRWHNHLLLNGQEHYYGLIKYVHLLPPFIAVEIYAPQTYGNHSNYILTQPETEEVVGTFESYIKTGFGYAFTKKDDAKPPYRTYFTSQNRWYDDVHSYYQMKNGSVVLNRMNQTLLLSPITYEPFITTPYYQSTFIYHKESIYATQVPSKPLTIYDLKGNIIIDSVSIISELDTNQILFKKKGKFFIGDLNGVPLTGFYDAIGNAQNGYRLVTNNGSYSFINDKTYKQVNFTFPRVAILRKDLPSESNLGAELVKGLLAITIVPLFVAPEIFESPEPNDLIRLEPSSGFHHGYAKVCFNKSPVDSTLLYIVSSIDDLNSFNYMNPEGHLLNRKQYLQATSFEHGIAWVKEKKRNGVVRIDTLGKTKRGHRYDEFETVEYQYVKTSDLRWHDGWFYDSWIPTYALYNPLGEQVFSCHCHRITYNKESQKFTCYKSNGVSEDYAIPEAPVPEW